MSVKLKNDGFRLKTSCQHDPFDYYTKSVVTASEKANYIPLYRFIFNSKRFSSNHIRLLPFITTILIILRWTVTDLKCIGNFVKNFCI